MILLILFLLPAIQAHKNTSLCGGFQANFNFKSVIGSWQVVAIIPEKLFPDKDITCFNVDFSETDEAGLRWLVNKTEAPSKLNLSSIKGPIIRQRYHSEHPFDVWSRLVDGTTGCFHQVLALDPEKSDIFKAVTHDATMQLHLMKSEDGSGKFLVQMLWGKMIAAVIYRRNQGITEDQLKPVFELMAKLRGPQRLPKICHVKLNNLHILHKQ
ncbi:uncharacterized protein LOC128678157 [Plodia interpunctella]|uniref:uncharacterized protein LOC128678157 n=1 Tax=Plodia interpunctella TaxID=58824 RepID=UPI002368180E|nr:uncharacterized protein LOC128678157 [Plodia interpunctella]